MNCCAYLEKATAIDPRLETFIGAVEFKWEGYPLPNAHIRAARVCRFDALWLAPDVPGEARFNIFCDAPYFVPQVRGAGRHYELTYLVVSDNFPPARRSFVLKLAGSLALTTLEPSPAG